MLRRGLCPRLSFAPFPRRIPRARLSPRAKEQAMPALRRPLPAFPSPVKCRRCPPRPPVFRPLRDGRFFARLFPGRAVFCSFSLRCACIHLCRGACEGGKRDRCAAAQTYSPFCAPFSRFKRTSPFFGRRKSFCLSPLLSLRTKDRLRRAKSFVRKRRACKARSVRPAAQPHIFRRTKAKRPAPHFRAAQGA